MARIELVYVPTLFLLLMTTAAPIPARTANENNGSKPAKIPRISEPRCKPIISEIFLDLGTNTRGNEFIELRLNCAIKTGTYPKNLLAGLKLLVIRAEPLSVVTYIDFDFLKLELTPKKEFLLLGFSKSMPVDVSLDLVGVQNVLASYRDNSKLLPGIEKTGFAVVVAQDSSKNFKQDFGLTFDYLGRYQPRAIGVYHKRKLMDKLVDMVVVGDQEHLSFFSSLVEETANQYIFIPNYRAASFSQKSSYSNCGNNHKPFQSNEFILALPTPGKENQCTAVAVLDNTPRNDNLQNIIQVTQKPQIHFGTENFLKYSTRTVNSIAIESCKKYLPVRETLLNNPAFNSWLDLELLDNKCKFSCFYCNNFFNLGFRPDVKHRPDMSTSTGYFCNDVYQNSKSIKAHAEWEMHKQAEDFSKKILTCTSQDEYNNVVLEFEERESVVFNATMNVILMVYVEAKNGISFRVHKSLMEGLRLIGSNVGVHHQTDVAAHSIVRVISDSFHKSLLQSLVRSRTFFSLMCDASTNTNQAFFICYIQTTEEGLPMSHMYSLIHLADGEKGAAMANAVINRIKKDEVIVPGFEDYFRTFLASITSDGCNSMVGDTNSFKTHFLAYINRKLPNVICMAHRLDTSIKYSLKKQSSKDTEKLTERERRRVEYFKGFEDNANKFFSFYVSRGHKKWIHFEEVAEELDIVPKRFKKFLKVRWSKSHYLSMVAIDVNYVPLVIDTRKISQGDAGFDKIAQEKALKLHNQLIDKTFAATVREFMDFLEVYSVVSERFQESSSILVGKVETLYDALEKIQSLKRDLGNNLKLFLAKCSCPGICAAGQCSLKQYDQCKEIKYENIILKTTDSKAVLLSQEREFLYSNLESGIKTYFKFDVFSAFELFDPKWVKFQTRQFGGESIDLYLDNERANRLGFASSTDEKINEICKFYFLSNDDCVQFTNDWKQLVKSISGNQFLFDNRNSKTVEFWKLALLQDIPWTTITKKIIQMVSVTSYSSSECERGFSFVNGIKTKDRSNMNKDTLDALVRIKANGPPVSTISAYKFARDFFFAGFARVDDESFQGGRPANEDKFPSGMKYSRIYMGDDS